MNRQAEMLATVLSLVPHGVGDRFKIVEIGPRGGKSGVALLQCFPAATLLGLEDSPSMRAQAERILEPYRDRAEIRPFQLSTLDWWDAMRGAHVIVSFDCLHRLNDTKKQYLFRAAAERVAPQGAFLVADRVQPQHPIARLWSASVTGAEPESASDETQHAAPLFFQLVWLKHAGFPIADCFWAAGGHAVYGGFKASGAPSSPPLSYATALQAAHRAFDDQAR